MRATSFSHLTKRLALFSMFLSLGYCATAFATVINFDELNPVYDEYSPCWCDNPLTDQYASKGLLISGAWVTGGNGSNAMLTSNFASLDFVNEFPTFVSMNVTSAHDDAIYFTIYGENGLLGVTHTAGWTGPDEEYIPGVSNEFVSLNYDVGIRSIVVEGLYGLRTGAYIDNLTFTQASVPEPSSVVLLGLGILGLTGRRVSTRFKKSKTLR